MLLFTFCANAQKVKVSFGVTGGGIATQMLTEPAPSSMYMGGYGGAFINIAPTKKLGLRAGANYAMQGGYFQMSNVPITLSQSYLNIPVTMMYNIKSFLSFEAGLYQNILLGAEYQEAGTNEMGVYEDDGALAYNVGAIAGVMINLGKNLFVNVRYCHGLSYSYAIRGVGYNSNAITAGVGVNLIRNKRKAF